MSEGGQRKGFFAQHHTGILLSPLSLDRMHPFITPKEDVRREYMYFSFLVCGGHLMAKTTVKNIYSHSQYGDVNYDNKEDCDWIIEAPPG